MASAFSGGALYRQGESPQTRTVLSSRFRIFAPAVGVGKFQRMGVTSSFNITESRNIDAVRGLGYGDIVAELVPGNTTPMELTITRFCLYLANIFQMLGYKAGASGAVRSLKHHKWPFDIRTEIVFPEIMLINPGNTGQATAADVAPEGGLNNTGNPGLQAIATVYEGIWINNYSTAYGVDNAAISEDVGCTVTDVFDIAGSVYGEFLDSGNSPQDATGTSLLYANG